MKAIVLVICASVSVLLPAGWVAFHSTPANAQQSAQSPSRCANVQLTIRLNGSNGAAGTIANNYRIHNLSNHACTLYGYPGVELLDGNFHSLPTQEHRGFGSPFHMIPARLVRVAAYGNAYFDLGYNDVPVNNQPCLTARYLMIFPPNDFLPVVTYAVPNGQGITDCTGNVSVSPVTPHPRFL